MPVYDVFVEERAKPLSMPGLPEAREKFGDDGSVAGATEPERRDVTEPRGLLKISAPPAIGATHIARAVAEFLKHTYRFNG